MRTLWITYAWSDNASGDVDFFAQELETAGLTVKLDRWNLAVGRRLWEQIANFITDPNESDAWLLIATQASLESEPCKEEFAYALGRSLDSRGERFPVIALFLGSVDEGLIPPAIRTRLFVSAEDPDWKERIVAAVEGRAPANGRDRVLPFDLTIHRNQPGKKPIAIEVRPRAGTWAPFVAGVRLREKDDVDPSIMVGARGVPTGTGMLVNTGSGESEDGKLWVMVAGNQATPSQSYYVWCRQLPSSLMFGVNGGHQYHVSLSGG